MPEAILIPHEESLALVTFVALQNLVLGVLTVPFFYMILQL